MTPTAAPGPDQYDLAITDAELIGSYAVNFAFSDGEARGIYPWAYLREIAATESEAQGK